MKDTLNQDKDDKSSHYRDMKDSASDTDKFGKSSSKDESQTWKNK
jgi:hypothetical protein